MLILGFQKTTLLDYPGKLASIIFTGGCNLRCPYCQKCGFDGEIEIREVDGKLVWTCPNCGNQDQDKMNVARRTCG